MICHKVGAERSVAAFSNTVSQTQKARERREQYAPRAFSFLFAMMLLLVGCGDPNDASEENFAVAIQNSAKTGAQGCLAPFSMLVDFPGEGPAAYADARETGRLDELKRLKLLDWSIQKGTPNKYTDDSKLLINLTPAGQAVFRARTGPRGEGGLCVGTVSVVEVESFTVPQVSGGYSISNVKYTWQLKDVAEWARDEALLAGWPELARLLKAEKEPVSARMSLVLTNKGWVNAQEALK